MGCNSRERGKRGGKSFILLCCSTGVKRLRRGCTLASTLLSLVNCFNLRLKLTFSTDFLRIFFWEWILLGQSFSLLPFSHSITFMKEHEILFPSPAVFFFFLIEGHLQNYWCPFSIKPRWNSILNYVSAVCIRLHFASRREGEKHSLWLWWETAEMP